MFPERLKDLRKEKGMTQIELATALGVSSGTVAMWETGKRKPSFEMFEKLTQVFDKRIDYILGTSDDPTPAKLNDTEVAQLGNWAMQEEYEDVMRKYSLLDDFGQKNDSCRFAHGVRPLPGARNPKKREKRVRFRESERFAG